MFCENCGSPLGESDKFCMKCGYRIPAAAEPNAPSEAGATEILNQEAAVTMEMPINQEAASAQGIPVNPEAVPMQETPVSPQTDWQTASAAVEELPRKKGFFRWHKGWVITVAVLAAGAVAAVVNASAINNFVHKTFSSPEKYYQFVEKRAMEDTAESIAANYQNYFLNNKDTDNQGVTASVELALTEEGSGWLSMAGLAGIDLSDLQSGKITLEMDKKDNLTGLRLLAGLNGMDIGALEFIMDLDDQRLYAGIPDFNETMLELSGELDSETMGQDSGLSSYEEQTEQMQALRKALPDRKELEKLLNRYIGVVLETIEDVEKGTETLEAEGVSQKCTALEVTLDGKSVEDIAKAIYEELEEDDEIKQIFMDAAEALDAEGDGEDLYGEFLDDMKSGLDDLGDEIEDGMEIVMTVYADSKGEVRGRKIELSSDYSSMELSSVMPRSGSKFGYELSLSGEGVTNALTGSGKYSGNKMNGDFELEISGASVLELSVKDFDTEKMKKGYPNGSVTISPSRQISALLGMSSASDDYGIASALSNLQLTLDMETSEKKEEIVLSLLFEEEKMASLTVSSESRKAKDVEVPVDTMEVEDEMDFEEWLEDFDWKELVDRLEDAGLPSELTDALEEAFER